MGLRRPVLAMVSLQSVGILSRGARGSPLLYWQPEALRQSAYTWRLGDRMLNADQVFVTWAEFIRRREQWLAAFGPRVFVRPDSGGKNFTGFVMPADDPDEWAHLARATEAGTSVFPETLVGVSAARPIDGPEWRCWAVDGEIVASSPYSWDVIEAAGEASRNLPPVPEACLALAAGVAAEAAGEEWPVGSAFAVYAGIAPISRRPVCETRLFAVLPWWQ